MRQEPPIYTRHGNQQTKASEGTAMRFNSPFDPFKVFMVVFSVLLSFVGMSIGVVANNVRNLNSEVDGITSGVDRVAVSVNCLEATSGEAIIQLLQHAAKLEKRVAELERINAERAGVGAAGPGDSSVGVSDTAADL